MVKYVSTKFSTFINEKVLNDKILDKMPIPSNISVGAQELDDYMYIPEIFDSNRRSFGKPFNHNLAIIQTRVGSVMGPLSQIWTGLDGIRRGTPPSGELDMYGCLDMVEKSITLLGQAYKRRMNILYNLT